MTDRYTGYRNNLTRGSREPVRMEPKWADKTRRTEYINTLNSGRPWTGELYTPVYTGLISTYWLPELWQVKITIGITLKEYDFMELYIHDAVYLEFSLR